MAGIEELTKYRLEKAKRNLEVVDAESRERVLLQ